mgnify:CR=1 FL=1
MMKIVLIIAAILIVFGIVLFVVSLASNNWDISQLNTGNLQSNTYSIAQDFQNISVRTDTTDVILVPSDNGICRVECNEQKNMQHLVTVKDQTLDISTNDNRKWFEHISFFCFDTAKITIYLPRTEYAALHIENDTGDVEIPKEVQFESVDISVSTGDVKYFASATEKIKLKTSTGDILVQGITAGNMELSVSTGNTKLTDVQCQNLRSTGSTGDLHLQSVIASEQFSIERSTGDVKLDCCDAGEIKIETDTGHVTGSLLSPKIFIIETDTGRVDVPKSITGGRCEIETDTGNIKITRP